MQKEITSFIVIFINSHRSHAQRVPELPAGFLHPLHLVRDNSDLFGDVFIILPNPMYGDWESAIWNGKKVTPHKADKLNHEALYEY